jgi:hypothetical protein
MLHVVPAGILSFPSGYTVKNAIWLDGSADELTFTPSQDGTGAGKKYTLSFWTKIIGTESTGSFFCAGQSGGDSLHIQTDWTSGNPFLNFTDSSTSGSNWLRRVGTRVLRDPTAWMHICFAVDNSSGGGLAGTANAARVYINGVEDTSFASASAHPASTDTSRMTMQYEHVIGNGAGFNDFKSFYLAEFVIVDGQQLTPASFGEYDDNGVWVPINVSGLTFGNNGCYLDFALAQGSGNGPGNDVSGKNNHFTNASNNITTAQTVTDTCTDNAARDISNYATWNPLTLSGGTLSEGNTKFAAGGASQGCLATIGASSGKYFCEAVMDRLTNGTVFFGVKPTSASLMTTASAASPWNQQQNLYFSYFSLDNLGGNIIDPQTASAISDNSSKYTVADGSTVGCLLDLDNYQVRWYKLDSGSWVQITNSTAAASTVGLFPAGAQWTFVARGSQSGDNVTANFGHTAFSATPPESAVALNTANLAAPTVTKPNDNYKTITYEGAVVATSSRHTASGVTSNGTNVSSFNASQLIDNNSSTAGIRVDGTGGELSFDLGSAKAVGAVGMFMDNGGGNNQACTWSVLYSDNNSDFTDTSQDVTYSDGGESSSTEVIKTFSGSHGTHRYWKLTVESRNGSESATSGKIYGINLYSANAHEITGVGFQPDFVWIKNRDASDNHMLFDSVRGATKDLHSNTNDTEATTAESLKSFDTDGFTLGTDDQVNTSSESYIAWCWKAGGSASSNSNGSITTSVSAADHGGFSIATWTGNGSAGATIGHGLSRKPAMGLFRRKSLAQDWAVYHEGSDNSAPEDKYLNLNLTNGVADATWLNDTPPSASLWTLGTSGYVNTSSETFVAYSFARTPGLIGIGSYTGNDSADGTYVVVDDGASGFRPAWLLLKNINDSESWVIFDSARSIHNPVDGYLKSDSTDGDGSATGLPLDFTANGFKQRNHSNMTNEDTIIYLAFAEHPFGGDTVAQARAR